MSLYVCPAAVVDAPCARVWEVLRAIPSEAGWMGGVAVQHAVPPGLLQPGQTLRLGPSVFGRGVPPWLEIDVVAIEEQDGFLDLRVRLPLGIVNDEHMTLAPLLDGAREACRVQFG